MGTTGLVGVLGGMGPLATMDFVKKVHKLSRVETEYDELPMIVLDMPGIPDRTAAILNEGTSPLPALMDRINILNSVGVEVVAMPNNAAHHWIDTMRRHSRASVLHIGEEAVKAVPKDAKRVAVLATGGALVSGFYQELLRDRGMMPIAPVVYMQQRMAECVAHVKARRLDAATEALVSVINSLDVDAAILGGSYLSLVSDRLSSVKIPLVDSATELAKATVCYAQVRRTLL